MEILDTIFGSFFLILTWWFFEKNKIDSDKEYADQHSWSDFAIKNYDDAIYALVCGIVLGIYREEVVYFLIVNREWDADSTWNSYYEMEGLILFGFGYFGTMIIKFFVHVVEKIFK